MTKPNLAELQTERAAKEAIFLSEHGKQAAAFVPTGAGIPGPAGKGPTQSNDTPASDSGDGLKA